MSPTSKRNTSLEGSAKRYLDSNARLERYVSFMGEGYIVPGQSVIGKLMLLGANVVAELWDERQFSRQLVNTNPGMEYLSRSALHEEATRLAGMNENNIK